MTDLMLGGVLKPNLKLSYESKVTEEAGM